MMQRQSSGSPERSRAEYSALNAGTGMAVQSLTIILSYIARVIFTRTLSASYVGVNGLFSDLLGILALSELGIGPAMSFALYRPAATGDIPAQQALMKLYQRLYLGVAAAVGLMGLVMLPFLETIAGEASDVKYLVLDYLLYLGNSVISYLLVYRQSIITAHQREYVISLYSGAFCILRTAVQIAILVTLGNFLLYLIAGIVCTILCNLCISRQADRMYPFLREKTSCRLPDKERLSIRRNIRALTLHRLGAVVINSTDNLLLSLFAGIATVGLYSNYYMVISSVRQVLDRLFRSLGASVGNLGAAEDWEAMEPVFQTAFFFAQWIYGVAAICLYELLPPFIELSFGAHFLMDSAVVCILCLLFFYHGLRTAIGTFWYALGMFQLDQYKALAEAMLNLVFSIILGRLTGITGVFLGTLFSALLTSAWLDPCLFFWHCLKKPVWPFFRQYAGYLAVLAADWGVVHVLCGLVQGPLLWVLAVRLAICAIVGDGVLLAMYFRRREFKLALELFIEIAQKNLRILRPGSRKR
ncbi:MAG: lipopolysaccharide biosynthesis protein [Oscillibacter sp.]|nr:lipopolysaccharide biosynthesis protein [Oscillibacter sp.]